MKIDRILEEKKMTKYQLAKLSGVPYSTIEDLCSKKTNIKKCNAGTLYMLCKVLDISMESMVAPLLWERADFENFKSNVCHELKQNGDKAFVQGVIERNVVQEYYDLEWYPEALYMLSMVDYVSRINGIPLCVEYAPIRKLALPELLYPLSVRIFEGTEYEKMVKKKALEDAIPEFLQHNIVEGDIRDVA